MCKLILGHSLSLHSIECKLIGYEFPLGKLICRQTIFSFCTDNFLFLYDIFCTEWGEIREFWKNPWVYIEFTKLTLSSEWTQTQYWVHMWVYLGKLDSLDVSWVQWHNSWVCCRSGKKSCSAEIDSRSLCLTDHVCEIWTTIEIKWTVLLPITLNSLGED